MGRHDVKLQRLLKMAAAAKDEEISGAPFGFETRVFAKWRELRGNGNHEVVRFLRRIAFLAITITLFAGATAYQEISDDEETGEALTNDYAIADTTIERQILQ